MQLTGTNRSIGLIALINQCPSNPSSSQKSNGSCRQSAKRGGGQDNAVMRSDLENQLLLQHFLSFAGLVAFARWLDPIPSRTRPSNASAPMVLCLKTWESRSPPGLQRTENILLTKQNKRACLKSTPFRPSEPAKKSGKHRRGVEQPGSSSGS